MVGGTHFGLFRLHDSVDPCCPGPHGTLNFGDLVVICWFTIHTLVIHRAGDDLHTHCRYDLDITVLLLLPHLIYFDPTLRWSLIVGPVGCCWMPLRFTHCPPVFIYDSVVTRLLFTHLLLYCCWRCCSRCRFDIGPYATLGLLIYCCLRFITIDYDPVDCLLYNSSAICWLLLRLFGPVPFTMGHDYRTRCYILLWRDLFRPHTVPHLFGDPPHTFGGDRCLRFLNVDGIYVLRYIPIVLFGGILLTPFVVDLVIYTPVCGGRFVTDCYLPFPDDYDIIYDDSRDPFGDVVDTFVVVTLMRCLLTMTHWPGWYLVPFTALFWSWWYSHIDSIILDLRCCIVVDVITHLLMTPFDIPILCWCCVTIFYSIVDLRCWLHQWYYRADILMPDVVPTDC